MSVQKIQLEMVQKVRQHIQQGLALPPSENHPRSQSDFDDAELPEPDSLSSLGDLFNFGSPVEAATHAPNNRGKWFISAANPGAVLMKLPGLTLKPGLRLVGYLHRLPDDGNGVIWAIPEALSTTAQLEKALDSSGDRAQPPHPQGALADLMAAVEGDRSPASFVIASLLQRELREFGKLGKSCYWSHHRLINILPTQVQWEWQIEPPKDLSPKVRVFPDGKAAIEFFTCRIVPPVALFQHLDQYPGTHYKATVMDRAIAVAKRL